MAIVKPEGGNERNRAFLQALMNNPIPQIQAPQPQVGNYPVTGMATPRLDLGLGELADRKAREREANKDREFSQAQQARGFEHDVQMEQSRRDYEDTRYKKERKDTRKRDRRLFQQQKDFASYQDELAETRIQRERAYQTKLDRARRMQDHLDTQRADLRSAWATGLANATTPEEENNVTEIYSKMGVELDKAELSIGGQMEAILKDPEVIGKKGQRFVSLGEALSAIDTSIIARNIQQMTTVGREDARNQDAKRKEILRTATRLRNLSDQKQRAYDSIYQQFGSLDIVANDGTLRQEHPLVTAVREAIKLDNSDDTSVAANPLRDILVRMNIRESSGLGQAVLSMADPYNKRELKPELDIVEAAVYDFASDLEQVVLTMVKPEVQSSASDAKASRGFFTGDLKTSEEKRSSALSSSSQTLLNQIRFLKETAKPAKAKWNINATSHEVLDRLVETALNPETSVEELQSSIEGAKEESGDIGWDKDLVRRFAADLFTLLDDPNNFHPMYYDVWYPEKPPEDTQFDVSDEDVSNAFMEGF